MATTVDQVATDALGLPTRSRALLVEKLLASLAGETDGRPSERGTQSSSMATKR
jgi:hypothetical protein